MYYQQCKIKKQLEDHWFASFRSFIYLPQAIYSKSEQLLNTTGTIDVFEYPTQKFESCDWSIMVNRSDCLQIRVGGLQLIRPRIQEYIVSSRMITHQFNMFGIVDRMR